MLIDGRVIKHFIIPEQFVGISAFVVGKVQAFGRRMLATEHAPFDKLFGHLLLKLAPVQEQFVALMETAPLAAFLQLDELAHFDL